MTVGACSLLRTLLPPAQLPSPRAAAHQLPLPAQLLRLGLPQQELVGQAFGRQLAAHAPIKLGAPAGMAARRRVVRRWMSPAAWHQFVGVCTWECGGKAKGERRKAKGERRKAVGGRWLARRAGRREGGWGWGWGWADSWSHLCRNSSLKRASSKLTLVRVENRAACTNLLACRAGWLAADQERRGGMRMHGWMHHSNRRDAEQAASAQAPPLRPRARRAGECVQAGSGRQIGQAAVQAGAGAQRTSASSGTPCWRAMCMSAHRPFSAQTSRSCRAATCEAGEGEWGWGYMGGQPAGRGRSWEGRSWGDGRRPTGEGGGGARTSGVLPQLPTVVQPVLLAVCSHW